MKRSLIVGAIALLLSITGIAAEKKVQMKDLPAAVQKAVTEQIKGAELKGLTEEVENGKTVYEVETIKNGRTRDVVIDATGAVLEVEEAVDLKDIPAPAKAAIEKAAAGGKITKVETITKNGVTSYEAAISKLGKHSEVKVAADGVLIK
jgi:uncharacterized membrane protein YkoI